MEGRKEEGVEEPEIRPLWHREEIDDKLIILRKRERESLNRSKAPAIGSPDDWRRVGNSPSVNK